MNATSNSTNLGKLSFYLLILLVTASANSLSAQTRTSSRHSGINLSIWKNISTQRFDTIGSTWMNVGIFSSINNLNGFGVNILGSNTNKNVEGVQIAGISNLVGNDVRGMQFAGITNIVGNDMKGVNFSGLVGITGSKMQGISFSGLTNIVGNDSKGVMLGGVLNISGNNVKGVQIAGLSNICGTNLTGLALSGLLNVTGNNMKGIQLSGLGNITGGEMTGAQIGAANVAVRAKGVQIGLFNYYKEKIDGIQLGLVNANPNTRIQMMVSGGIGSGISTGVRFLNNSTYSIIGIGSYSLGFQHRHAASIFYRAGMYTYFLPRVILSIDGGFGHVETFADNRSQYPKRLYQLQGRASIEYKATERFGLFISGGYGSNLHYGGTKAHCYGPIFEIGTVFLRYATSK